MAVGSRGTAASNSDPASILAKAKTVVGGNPDEVKAYAQAFLDTFFDPELDTDEKRAAAQASIYKSAKVPSRTLIDVIYNGADDRKKGKASTTSKSKDGKAPNELVIEAQAIYRNPPKDKLDTSKTMSGDALDVHVLEKLREKFGTTHKPEVYLTARDTARDTTRGSAF